MHAAPLRLSASNPQTKNQARNPRVAFRALKEIMMCELARERKRIDSILAEAMNQNSVRLSIDEVELAGYGLAALRSHYALSCSDECMRKRCDEFAALVALSRRAQQHAWQTP
jgi:hypothetical protein